MKKIMVVDDNADNMALIVEILEDAEYISLEFGMAETALSYLEDNLVDLILMDVSLPQMNGLDATRLVKGNPRLKDIPVFMLSAHAMSKDIEAGLAAGCDDYITKPIDEDNLLEKISHILEHKAAST